MSIKNEHIVDLISGNYFDDNFTLFSFPTDIASLKYLYLSRNYSVRSLHSLSRLPLLEKLEVIGFTQVTTESIADMLVRM